ncbi:MAG TPA: NAD-dependent epimerase/dehydratase family protein, partial [Bryobacteraceae bacterium]|nr:NAD-dependent epimerase/dehydratase family protein [Bryobacteraceae bacterium]
MKILNLGAGGFIGSHLTQRLLAEGHTVTAVDLWSDKVSELLDHPRLSFVQQDIRSSDWNLDALVADADLVIDLIAHANPGLYIRIPLEVFHLNFEENLKIAEACVRHRKRLIQFSTCEVYGRTAASLKNARVADPEDPIHATFSEDHSEFIL